MPCKKKKYNSRFPPARIKKIMQSDDEVGKVAAVVPVIISRVLEIFVENLLKDSCKITKQRNARTLTPSHIKATILQNSQLDFLKEIVSLIPDIQGLNEDEQIDYNQQQLDYANFYPNNSSANSSHHKLIKQLSHPATSPNQQLNNDLSTITDQLPQLIKQQQSQATSSFPLNSNNNKNFKNYSRSNSAPSTTTINEFNEQKKSKLKKQQEDYIEEEDDYDLEEEDESLSENDDEEVFSASATIAKQPIKKEENNKLLSSTSENSFKVSKKELVEDDDYDT